jgi:hypothetical protein
MTDPLVMSLTLAYELNCILLLDYKFTLPKYDIKNTGLVGPKVCAIGREAF